MSDLRILHWSDLHFAANPEPRLSPSRAVELAAEAVERDFSGESFVLALSGDITTRGEPAGYTTALRSIAAAKAKLNISEVVSCPGNHDISPVNGRDFEHFNKFAFDVSRDSNQYWNSARAVSTVLAGDYTFLLVNSAFEGNHRFGNAPVGELRAALSASRGTHQIVMLHHSPISSAYAGGGMANAYELLALVSDFGASAILHGHVHSDQGLRIGSQETLLFGAGSLGFEPDPNMNNQFVVHDFERGTVVGTRLYRYHRNTDQFEAES